MLKHSKIILVAAVTVLLTACGGGGGDSSSGSGQPAPTSFAGNYKGKLTLTLSDGVRTQKQTVNVTANVGENGSFSFTGSDVPSNSSVCAVTPRPTFLIGSKASLDADFSCYVPEFWKCDYTFRGDINFTGRTGIGVATGGVSCPELKLSARLDIGISR